MLFTLSWLLFTSSCGYQFRVGGAGPVVGGTPPEQATEKKAEAPKIRIATFRGGFFQPDMENKYTSYARYEFAATSGAEVVADLEPADYTLRAQVVNVIMPSLTFTQTDTFESRVTITVKATIEDLRTSQTVWTQYSTQSSEFFITNNLQFNMVLQSRALEQAGKYIAQDLATRFLGYLQSAKSDQAVPAAGDAKPKGVEPAPAQPDGAAGDGPE